MSIQAVKKFGAAWRRYQRNEQNRGIKANFLEFLTIHKVSFKADLIDAGEGEREECILIDDPIFEGSNSYFQLSKEIKIYPKMCAFTTLKGQENRKVFYSINGGCPDFIPAKEWAENDNNRDNAPYKKEAFYYYHDWKSYHRYIVLTPSDISYIEGREEGENEK
jgi:hypothetical protein